MTENTIETTAVVTNEKLPEQTGRNEPCPCGSGKKFKRCHGVDAAPKLTAPAVKPATAGPNPALGGFDPSQMDPEMMKQMAKTLQRLPKSQLMKMQGLMQRAMAGQDVSRESAEFEKMLPPEFSQMAMQMMMAQGMAGGAGVSDKPMDAADAKQIVAKAVAEGKMTAEQAKELLGDEDPAAILAKAEKKGISGFFKKITGK